MMDSAKPTRPAIPNSLTAGNLPSLLGPIAVRQELSSNTWASSTADMALLSDNDEIEDRDTFIEDYNRLAGKYGVRLMVPDDYDSRPYIFTQPEKKKWYSRRRGSITRLASAKSDKSVTQKSSFGDLPSHVDGTKADLATDQSLQGLIRLTGKCFLHLPAEYAPGSLAIPTCLRATSQYLVQHGPTARGVFRVPGSVRAVAVLYDYYFANSEPGGVAISGTVRTPGLPTHLDYGVHDVASTFKKFLGGLPGGILGSLSVFDALVAIHSQFNGDPEANRTKQTKLRARLIALAIGTLKSQFQRELVCAVFGLLCLIGRTSETFPREDARGRPLPTSDLMGYNALGIIFGPLLVGNLIDQYSMQIAEPGTGLVLLPVTPPSRKDKAKRRAASEGRPVTPVTIDKIIVANSIAEMLISNWREVVRQMKSLGVIHKPLAGQMHGEPSKKSLNTSVSESVISKKVKHPLEGNTSAITKGSQPHGLADSVGPARVSLTSQLSDQEDIPEQGLTVKKHRQSTKPRTVVFGKSNMLTHAQPEISYGAARKNLTKRRPNDVVSVQKSDLAIQGGSESGAAVPTPASARPSALLSTSSVTFKTPVRVDQKMSRRLSSAYSSTPPSGHRDGVNLGESPAEPEALFKDATTAATGIFSKASRAISKLTTAHRGSRAESPLDNASLQLNKSPNISVRRTLSARSGNSAHGSKLEGRPLSATRDYLELETDCATAAHQDTKALKALVSEEAETAEQVITYSMTKVRDGKRFRDAEFTFDIISSARLVPRSQVGDTVNNTMVGRSNALRQNKRSIGPNSSLSGGNEIMSQDVVEADSGSRIPKPADAFHIKHEDIDALRDRGSPTIHHEDIKWRLSRSVSRLIPVDKENPVQYMSKYLPCNSQNANGNRTSIAFNYGPAVDSTGKDADETDSSRYPCLEDKSLPEYRSRRPPSLDQAQQNVLDGATALTPPPLPTPNYASIPGSTMQRKYVSVSGGNVRAMAAIFENVGKDTRGSTRRQHTTTATEPSTPAVLTTGSATVLPQYVQNSTPPRPMRSMKSWRSDDFPFACNRASGFSVSAFTGDVVNLDTEITGKELPNDGKLFEKGYNDMTETIAMSHLPPDAPIGYPLEDKSHCSNSESQRAFDPSYRYTTNRSSLASPSIQSSDVSARIDALHVNIYGLEEQLAAKTNECTHVRLELMEAQNSVASAATTARAVESLTSQLNQTAHNARHWRDEALTWRARAEATERRLTMIRGQVGNRDDVCTTLSTQALVVIDPRDSGSAVMMPISQNQMHRGLHKKRAVGPLRQDYAHVDRRPLGSEYGECDNVGSSDECDWRLDGQWQRDNWRVDLDGTGPIRNGKEVLKKDQDEHYQQACSRRQEIRFVEAIIGDGR